MLDDNTTVLIRDVIAVLGPIVTALVGLWINSRLKTTARVTGERISETNVKVEETKAKVEEAAANIVEQKAGLQEQQASVAALVKVSEADFARRTGTLPPSLVGSLSDTRAKILALEREISELREQEREKGVVQQVDETLAAWREREKLK